MTRLARLLEIGEKNGPEAAIDLYDRLLDLQALHIFLLEKMDKDTRTEALSERIAVARDRIDGVLRTMEGAPISLTMKMPDLPNGPAAALKIREPPPMIWTWWAIA